MKMRYLIPAVVALLLSAGCERDRRNDNLYASAVYFVDNMTEGVVATDTMYDVQQSVDYPVYVYCSGYYGGTTTVSMSVDEAALTAYNENKGTQYRLLPADCYEITSSSATIENRKATMGLRFNVGALTALSAESDYSDLEDYVVPLALHSTEEIPVSTRDEYLGYSFVHPTLSQAVLDCSLSGKVVTVSGRSLTMTVSLPFDNEWQAEWNMEVSGGPFDGLAATESTFMGNTLPAAYAFAATTPSVENGEVLGMEPGVNEVSYTISLPEDVEPGIYTVNVRLDGARLNGMDIPIDGGDVDAYIRFEVDASYTPAVSSTDTSADAQYLGVCPAGWSMTAVPRSQMVFSPESVSGDVGANAIDGNTATKWENRYGSTGYGPTSSLPFLAVADLGAEVEVSAVEVWRRADSYVADLGCFEVYAARTCDYSSPEQIEYEGLTYLGNVDFGDAGNTSRAMFRMVDSATTRYLIFKFTRSNRNDSCISISELGVWHR